MTDTAELAHPETLAARPVPAGRGRWRLVAYNRQFSNAFPTPIAELVRARGRRLDLKLNAPAELTFTLDGHDPSAALLLELATDVIAYRWNDPAAADVAVFRGLIDHSEDQITEQSATVTFTVHDYSAVLGRRMYTTTYTATQREQDYVAADLVSYGAHYVAASGGTSFTPGNWLPITTQWVGPDGSNRGASTQLRDRIYPPNTAIGQALSDLAAVVNGFDYDVRPGGPSQTGDALRIFYPQQGVTRTDLAFVYGANVNTVTRTVASGDYANYVRVLGNNGSADPAAAQLYAEQWNTDVNNVTVNPVGLWQMGENAADVTVQSTLTDKANGDLGTYGLLMPSYTLGLRPGAYSYGNPNLGDTVPLVVTEGRLNVNTTVRVVGITYDVGDNGDENVTLTVGRPRVTLASLLTQANRDIDALTRR